MAHAPRKHDPTTAAFTEESSGHLWRSVMVGRPVDDGPARTRHPDPVALDGAVQVAAATVLLEEGIERVEQGHARECSATRRPVRAPDLAPKRERRLELGSDDWPGRCILPSSEHRADEERDPEPRVLPAVIGHGTNLN
jgi:hypothetical protein